MNVLFVDMPFAAQRPAIGVSLLKAHLDRMGVPSRVAYLNLRYAELVSPRAYRYVADQAPSQSLAGDWVFAAALFGARPDADEEYFRIFRERFRRSFAFGRAEGMLRRCRAVVEPFLERCLDEVPWADYDLVGFTSTFTQHVASLALARRVKERHPEVLVAFGGANCEAEMGVQLHRSFPFVDLVFSGEADLTFPRVLSRLRAGEPLDGIPGLVRRVDGRTRCDRLTPDRVRDLDELPHPNFDDFFGAVGPGWRVDGRAAAVLMESSRGCWWGEKHHCTFCGLNGTSMAFRRKGAERVLEEMLGQCERYEASYVEMVDNILDMRYFDDLLPELARRRLKLGLFYETKANLTKDQLRLLRDAGVTAIQPGIESFSTEVLRLMRKGTSAAQNVQLLKWCKELGIGVYWNLLYGFPGETPAAYEATASVIDALVHLEPPKGVGQIRLDRFSPNYADAAALGLTNVRPDRSYGCIYDLPAEDLAGLAYYFEHDYADGRRPDDYVASTYAAVLRWHEQSSGRGLVYADHGDTLGVWDFRAGAEQTLTILDGWERELYVACDRYRSRAQVEALAAEHDVPAAELDAVLDRLVAARLMLAVDGRYLSLAVLAGPHPAEGEAARRAGPATAAA